MTRINCSDKDCSVFIEISGPVAPNATYTCRIHSGEDTKNQDIHFQNYQFDPELTRGRTPEGTSHIPKSRYRPAREVEFDG